MNDTTERSQTHATFVVERTYPVPVAAVWYALSDNDARDQWFGGGPTFEVTEKSHDFRVGGRGTEDGRWHDGPRSRFESTYTDIVDQRRIVFTYDMWVDDQHLSTSLTTIAVEPDSDATRPWWVVCLCAQWCGVCNQYRSTFAELASQFPQMRFVWLDVEDREDVAAMGRYVARFAR